MNEKKRRPRLPTKLRGAKAGPSYAHGEKWGSREGCREGTRSDGCVQESRKLVGVFLDHRNHQYPVSGVLTDAVSCARSSSDREYLHQSVCR